MSYNHQQIESKWQKQWEEEGQNQVKEDKNIPRSRRRYVLDMFPYPSAAGLHVGHPEGYTATDIYSRYLRMCGYHVLHPMGWDAFGLPAENYAIKQGVHPKESTYKNIDNFRRQIKSLGFSYDWSREIATCDADYYKWTQWFFLLLYKNGLAYRKKAPVNWCQSCQTVLAREQVIDGKCERCKSQVIQKELEQWFFRITDYAERLLSDLDKIDWPEPIKLMQRNWIGRSEGAVVKFPISNFPSLRQRRTFSNKSQIPNPKSCIEVFTTRIDTIFGVTYLVVAPEHELITNYKLQITNYQEVKEYIEQSKKKTELQRTDLAREKTGVEIKGINAINPATGEAIPVWVADYVLMSYGTGAIMAVPAHDERDFEFAIKYNLPIRKVIKPINLAKFDGLVCYTGEGILVNSRPKIKDPENISGSFKRSSGAVVLNNINHWHGVTIINNDKKVVKLTGNGVALAPGLAPGDQAVPMVNQHYAANQEATPQLLYQKGQKDVKELTTQFDGMTSESARRKITEWLESKNLAQKSVQYKLRDWLISRQRYWGAPIPIIYCYNCGEVQEDFLKNIKKESSRGPATSPSWFPSPKVRDGGSGISTLCKNSYQYYKCFGTKSQEMLYKKAVKLIPLSKDYLPVELPNDIDFRPTGESPLARSKSFHNVKCPRCGSSKARRESDTMDTFVCSSWYYLRYTDPRNDNQFASKEKIKYWLPVSVYVGGAEHAVMHLLYARFFCKVLYDHGLIDFDEPFQRLINQGLILAEDGRKMSKSLGNVINPDDIVKNYGADTLRMYEMFMGPLEDAKPWSMEGIRGVRRFLEKVWRLFQAQNSKLKAQNYNSKLKTDNALDKLLHKTIKKVGEDIENFKFNTAISQLMILVNTMQKSQNLPITNYQLLIILLAPFAPHLTEELWQKLGNKQSVFKQKWPEYDADLVKEELVTMVVQVNGKVRDQIEVETAFSKEQILKQARSGQKMQKWLSGQEVKKEIYVPGKLVNFVV